MGNPKRLTKIQYDRIDRVGSGAQPGAHVTLVKARRSAERPVRVAKVIDPASIDAKVQAVRQEFWSMFNQSGCCYDCSGWVYVDAVYDGFLIGCDDDGQYWRIPYTLGAGNDVTFDTPEAVEPSVTWSTDSTADSDDAPVPVNKAKALWVRAGVDERKYFTPAELEKANKKKPVKKETTVPTAVKDIDLSALPEEDRETIAAAIAERDQLAAAAAEREAADDAETDEDLSSIEGIQKAIRKSKSPEIKRVLTATLARLEKAEKEAGENRETTARLQKAERVRLFKDRASELPHIAAHLSKAATEDAVAVDGTDALAGLLEQVDATAGSEVAEAVEAVLQKAHIQVRELLGMKGILKSVGRGPGTAGGRAVAVGIDPEAELQAAAAELRKAQPELSDAQAKVRVLKARPDLYAASIAG